MTMKKTEIPGIYKVTDGILVNKDNESLMKYKARKAAAREQDIKINTLIREFDEIKVMLRQLMER